MGPKSSARHEEAFWNSKPTALQVVRLDSPSFLRDSSPPAVCGNPSSTHGGGDKCRVVAILRLPLIVAILVGMVLR